MSNVTLETLDTSVSNKCVCIRNICCCPYYCTAPNVAASVDPTPQSPLRRTSSRLANMQFREVLYDRRQNSIATFSYSLVFILFEIKSII